MYKLEYLPIAKSDIDNIINYIAIDLKNKIAARKLVNNFMNAINVILEFPYSFSIYQFSGILKNEYRSIKVGNFLMFYVVNDKERLITIIRVLYQKMDISNIPE